MARRALRIGLATGTLGVAATVGALVGTAPAASSADGSMPGFDALHPNLLRSTQFVTGSDGVSVEVPTQPGVSYELDFSAPAGRDYEVTFGTGTAELSGTTRSVVLDVGALDSMTRLTMAGAGGAPVLPAQVAVRRLD